jgi:hypothetical protein
MQSLKDAAKAALSAKRCNQGKPAKSFDASSSDDEDDDNEPLKVHACSTWFL